MENNGFCDVMTTCGGTGTYETVLAQTYSVAGSCQSDSSCSAGGYTATSHPSEGNYISLIGGDSFGHTNDSYCCWGLSSPNIIDRIEASGRTWQAWAEDAGNTGTCSFSPPRTADHFAFLTFADMNTPARCSHFQTTASSSDPEFLSALNSTNPSNYIWLTPNENNNGHDTGVSGGDNYLSVLVPKILSSQLFTTKNAALFIVYDEGTSNYPKDYVYASWAGPVVKKGFTGKGSYDHYSYLKTLETVWALNSLTSNDANATPMTEFFTSTPSGSTLRASIVSTNTRPSVDQAVTFTAIASGGIPPYSISWDFGDGGNGTGNPTSHTYASPDTDSVTLTVKDAAGSVATSSIREQVMTPIPTRQGDFGSCTSLPQGWNCGNTNGLNGSSATIVKGVVQTRQLNRGAGNDTNYYYATSQKGTFPWSPCQAPSSVVIPEGTTSVNATFTMVNFVGSGSYRYHIFLALYYWLPDGPISSGSLSYRCLDTQVRAENINGFFSDIGSAAIHNPGDSFAWDQVTVGQVLPGQTYTLSANVADQCRQDLAAWGFNSTTRCVLAGIEVGTEGFQFQEIDVNFNTLQLVTTGPPPPPRPRQGSFDGSWYTGNIGGSPTAGSVLISNGTLYTKESTAGGDNNNYGYVTAQKGAFPWSPTQPNYPRQGTMAQFKLESYVTTIGAGSRYHVYVGLYFRLANPVTVGGVTHSWLDTQLRLIEYFNGRLSIIGTTSSYDAGDSFGYSRVIGTNVTSIDAEAWFKEACNTYGINPAIAHTLAGVEVGTEGFHVAQIDTTWSDFHFADPSPPLPALKASVNAEPILKAGELTNFTAQAAGGSAPYNYTWNFGDGSNATGTTVQHKYATIGRYTITLAVTDNSVSKQAITVSITVWVISDAPSGRGGGPRSIPV